MARSSALRVIAGCLTLAVSLAIAGAASASGWLLQRTPRPAGATYSRLIGVSCPAPRSCLAVGYSSGATGTDAMLAERWNGAAWAIVRIPAPAGAQSSYLSGVSCSAPRACTAVGYFTDTTGMAVPLAERWDGSAWTAQPVPVPVAALYGDLVGVSCPSAVACAAVGSFRTSAGAELALIERWTGTAWAVQPGPRAVGASGSALKAVSCSGAAACTAAGELVYPRGTTNALAERWDGSRWSIERPVKPSGASASDLFGVSCPAARSCAAVGYFIDRASVDATLGERWNGTGWAIRATPDPTAARGSELFGVSCPAPGSCTAVGNFADQNREFVTLAERWRGTGWVIQRTPRPGTAVASGLDAVSCSSPGRCVAVGYLINRRGTTVTLAERFS